MKGAWRDPHYVTQVRMPRTLCPMDPAPEARYSRLAAFVVGALVGASLIVGTSNVWIQWMPFR